mmetsp:Transcript_13695/g.27714  ORF Transcript_13695/g.27714 Transcript_13695/m.27714 type:complete len:323 (+) Transcript_13695:240-1208(+)|eukprot:CAMPEP_0167787334 /NCGR_PEP_ID=MMETSP0111_2-20121227/9355_1 /TAXON_ID=91324 /ORGANISM="Lotharella globosa, Strain CCCM811" /LENGTH=322 /DNA_ID=CAMNT_0007678945 /DNA_START=224 /DNA_END=1192 /DNA_ORIENTATION=-
MIITLAYFAIAVGVLALWLSSEWSRFSVFPPGGVKRIDGVLKDVSQTAVLAAHCRSFAHRLGYVDDPVVGSLLPPMIRLHEIFSLPRAWLTGRVDDPLQLFGWCVARTKIIDFYALQAIKNGASSLIILGAGFDTRAYRLPLSADMNVFEVDSAPTQAAKREILQQKGIDASHVTFVAVDFNRERFVDKLDQNGFRKGEPAVIVWEGVASYLTIEATRAILKMIHNHCASGTVVLATFPVQIDAKDERDMKQLKVRKEVAAIGEPNDGWGVPEGEEKRFIESAGFELIEQLDSEALEIKFFASIGDPTRIIRPRNFMAFRKA